VTDQEKAHATYYALLLKRAGFSAEEAARAVVKRYPGTRAELEARGLLQPPESRFARWETPELAEQMEAEEVKERKNQE
jgi:hypothetical protein